GCAAGCEGCCAGCAALWVATVAATPSTTVTRIFFISVGSLHLWESIIFEIVLCRTVAFRMDMLTRSPSVFNACSFPGRLRELGVDWKFTVIDPSFPVGRIIRRSSSEGKQLHVYPLQYCIRCRS